MNIKKSKQDKINRSGNQLLISGAAGKPDKLRITTDHPGINNCLDFVARNFRRPIQLKHLAKASGLSRRGFVKAFNKHVGEKPGVLLRTVRLEHAKRLLMEQDLNSADIARQCGFRSHNTFAVAFQRDIGMAPKQFQLRYLFALRRHYRRLEVLSPDFQSLAHRDFPAVQDDQYLMRPAVA